jgi:hypothetical protein
MLRSPALPFVRAALPVLTSLVALGASAGCGPATPTADPPSASAAPSTSPSSAATAIASASSTASASASASATASPATSTSAASTAAAAPPEPAAPALPPVTLVQVAPAAAGKPPVLGLVAPAKNLVIPAAKAATFDVKLSAKEWKPASGEHLCLVLDKRPCRRVDDATKPIRLGDLGALDEGQHVLSVLARRASGEFFRPVGKSVPFASVSFFVGKKGTPFHKDGAPMLFYSPIERGPAPSEGVLLDFFVANGVVADGQFVVTASVGGPGIESGTGLALKDGRPLRLAGARPGEYISRFRLMQFVPELGESKALTSVTYTAKPVPGPFGEVERTFVVTK